METWRFRVYGRVQGVGYRAHCQDAAQALGLGGWVRNRADGTVEAVASGPVGQLERLHAWMQEGPPAGHVSKVEVEKGGSERFDGFECRPSA